MTCGHCGRISPAGTPVCPGCGTTLILELSDAAIEPPALPTPDDAVVISAAPWRGGVPLSRPEPESVLEPAPVAFADLPVPPPPAPSFESPPPSSLPWASEIPSPAPIPAPPEAPLEYAGFWRRFAAAFLDGIVLWAVSVPFFVLWILPHFGLTVDQFETLGSDRQMEIGGGYLLYFITTLLAEFMYFALFESSRRRATLGRIVVGIQVLDGHGQRIHLGRALGRRLARFLSGITIGIGFLVQLFTRRRQALHDVVAGTLVVRVRT
jgi:uncharacterized RDD family membrane protein YckC